MSPIVAAFIRSALLPAIGVTIAVFLTGGMKEPLRARIQALVIAAGFIIGHFLLIGRLGLPPGDVAESISYAALGLALFVVVYPMVQQAPYMVRALFVVVLGALVLWHMRHEIKGDMGLRNSIAFFCLGLGVWSIFERNVHRLNMLSILGLPLIVAACLSFILLFNASASFSQMVQILCALIGGLFVLSLKWPGRVSQAAVVPFLSVFLILIMAAGHFTLGVNPWKMVFLCIPFVLIWTRAWFPFIPRNPIVEFLILAIIALLPLAYFTWDSFVKAGPLY